MKSKIFKKISLTSLALLSAISFSQKVNAAEEIKQCKIYNNYYFFTQANDTAKLTAVFRDGVDIENPENKVETIEGIKYYILSPTVELQGLVGVDEKDILKNEQITLTRKDEEVWNLEEFYKKNCKVINDGTQVTDSDPDYKYYEEENSETGETNRYIVHGEWTINGEKNKNILDFCSIVENDNYSDIIGGSYLPNTTIEFESVNNKFNVNVTRKITESDFYPATGDGSEGFNKAFSISHKEGEEPKDTVLAPALYWIQYEDCSIYNVYNARIEYLYADTKKQVEFKDGSANPYTESELVPGYTNKKDSPKLEGCTPDKKDVTISIDEKDPKDFSAQVLYTCKKENADNNPDTGSALIIIAWIVGLSALGYSIYYFIKLKKSNA